VAQKLTEILELALKVAGEEEARKLSDAFKELGKTADGAGSKAGALVDELEKLEKVSQLAADFTRTQAALDKTENEIAQATAGLVALNKEFDASDKSSKAVTQAYAKVQKELARLTEQQIKQKTALDATESELKQAGVNTDQLADETARLQRESAKATKDLIQQADALKKNREAAERQAKAFETLGKNVTAARGRLNEILTSFTKVTAAAAAGAAALAAYGAGRFFKSALDEAVEFEHTINAVAAAAGGSADDIKRLSQAAEEAGKGLGFTGQEGAKALEALARAGLDVNESIGALPATLALARAGNLDVAESANRLADTLDQFNLSGEQAGATADKIAKAARESGTSVAQLTDALGTASPTARGAGASFETTAAALGLLAEKGIEGGKAGAALAQIFSQLQDPASAFSKALDAAGIKSRDFTTVIEALARGGKGTQEAIQALGTRGTAALQALLAEGGGALRKLSQDLQSAQGFAAKLAAEFSDDVAVAFLELNRAYEAARKSFLEPLLKPLAEELTALAGQIDAFAKSPEFEELKQSFLGLFTEASGALKRFIQEFDFQEAVASIRKFVDGVRNDFAQIRTDAQELATGLKAAGLAIQTFFNAVQTGVFGVATAMAKTAQIQLELLKIADSVDKTINPVRKLGEALGIYPDVTAKADAAIAGLQGVVDEFAASTATNANETNAAMTALGQAFQQGGDEAKAGAAKVTEAAAETQQAVGATDAAAQQSATVLGQIAVSLNEAISRSVVAAKEFSAAMATGVPEAIEAAKVKLAETTAEVNKLEASLGAVPPKAEAIAPAVDRAASSVANTRREVEQTSESVGQLSEDFQRYGGQVTQSTSNVVSLLTALNNEFASTSENARQLFVNIYNGGVRTATTFRQVYAAISEASQVTRRNIAEQTAGLNATVEGFARMASASDEALAQTYAATQQGADGLRDLAEATRQGEGQFRLLNQADLGKLASNIDAVAARVDALTAKAEKARQALEDIRAQEQDALDQATGNEEAIERRRHEERLRQIDDQARVGGASAQTLANEARDLARRNHEERMRQILEEQAARRRAAEEGQRQQQASSTQPRPGINTAQEPQPTASSAGAGIPSTSGGLTINLNGSGQMTEEQLRQIERWLREAQGRRG
jgi:TP901 family phage tail tape measure protein